MIKVVKAPHLKLNASKSESASFVLSTEQQVQQLHLFLICSLGSSWHEDVSAKTPFNDEIIAQAL